MNDYPTVEVGRELNEAGEPMVRVGGALCGTVDSWKRLIADFERRQIDAAAFTDGLYDPRKDPNFKEAVLQAYLDLKRKRMI